MDHGDIGRRVGAEHLGRRLLSVLERDGDLAGVGDDVLVGEDVALLVVHDAGALALGLLRAAEEAAAGGVLGHRDVHHARAVCAGRSG